MRSARFSSLPQLAGVLAGFTLCILLLESQALTVWAGRLEIGPGRQLAVSMTTAVNRKLQPVGFSHVRTASLAALDSLGWSDDPARLASASRAALASISCQRPAAKPGPKQSLAPLLASVPKSTPLPQLPQVDSDNPRTIALVGDSMMAVGLSPALLRETAANPNVRVVKAFRSGTGLARPDIFDWMQEYPAMIGAVHPDVVLVAMGANDGQGLVEGGKPLAFGSEAWIRAYQQRTTAFLNLLTEDGAQVVWIGLPPMKSATYNAHIALINRIAYSAVGSAPHAVWWNPQKYVADDSGNFREFATDDSGQLTRIRATDGIHLSDEGAALFAPTLVDWFSPPPPALTAKAEPPNQPALQRPVHHRRSSGR